MSWELNAFMGLDHWWHHKLKLPGGKWLCNRFDAWVMGGPWEDEQPDDTPVTLEHGEQHSKTESDLENPF